jgi:hypothetical protein
MRVPPEEWLGYLGSYLDSGIGNLFAEVPKKFLHSVTI